MSTTRPAASLRQEPNRARSSRSAKPVDESPAAGPRSPRPRVLARFPDLDAKQPIDEPVETFAGLDGRIINQKLARRILVGIACLLILAAVLPLAFRREGKKQGAGDTASSQPSWQPENPAPDASVAPVWGDAATRVDEAVLPRRQAAGDSALPAGHDDTAGLPHTSTFRAAEPPAAQTPGPPKPATDVLEQPRQQSQEQGALANHGQSIVPPDEAALDSAKRGQFDGADRADLARAPEYDRRSPTARSTNNQPSELPHAQSSVDRYGSGYQAAGPEPRYQQGGPAGYREPAPSYQPYQNDPAARQWQDSTYRDSSGVSVERRDYAAEPASGNWSSCGTGSAANSCNVPHSGDYRTQTGADYRSYQAPGYRSQQAADYRSQQPADYRSEQASGYSPQSTANHGYSPQAHDYRSVPATGNWSSPAAGAPSQPYYGTPNSQPAPGYYDGTGTHTAPGQGMPYYQADRRTEPAAGYAPYNAQPSGAHFQGTIEQPPVPAQYDTSGSRLY